jgi:N-acetylneuraminic acid mutarotase
MKKYIIAFLLAAVMASPALAGVWDVVEHLPSGLGASNMAVSRYYDASVGKDGIALVGGSTNSGDTSMAFFFNLADHGWTWLPNYPYVVSAAAAAGAGDTLYVHGGWSSPNVKDSTFKYANVVYNWASTNMNSLTPRSYHGLVNLYNRYLYAVGGTNNLGQTTASVERLDPQGGPPIYVQSMPQSRTCAVTVTALGADTKPHIYVLGGKDSLGNILNSVVEYDSGSGWITKATTMPVPRWQATGAVVNGMIYLIGGVIDASNTITRRVDIYNPVTNSWMLGDSIPVKIYRAGACGVNNAIYLFGGADPSLSLSDSVWLYRPFAPNPPPQLLPWPAAQLNYQQVDFYWGSVPAVTQYRIQVSSDSTFTTIDVANSLTADTNSVSLAIYLGPAGDYFWRVRAYDWALPDSSKWSPARKLTLDMTPPDAPVPISPENDTVTNNKNLTFEWNAVAGTAMYQLVVDYNNDLATPDFVDSSSGNVINTDISLTGKMFWGVRGRDVAGNWSGFHSAQLLTIDTDPPTLVSTDPYDAESEVELYRNITIVFSEAIDTLSLAFTCNPDPGGWNHYWSPSNDTLWLYHNEFNSSTNYAFTVTGAKDIAGNNIVVGSSGNPWYFSTVDNTPPNISTPGINTMNLTSGSGFNFTVYVSDNREMSSVDLYWGPAGSSSYNIYNMVMNGGTSSGGTYEYQIQPGEVYAQGVQYQIVARDTSSNTSYYPEMGDFYIHSVYYNSPSFTSNILYDKWQMVSIPTDAVGFNIFSQFDELGPYDNTKWRLFEWSNGQYREISNQTLGMITEFGRAYWLRHRTGINNVLFQGPNQSYGDFRQSKPCSLSLYSGWNDLGSPFQFNIDWMNVMIPSGVDGPYHYNGNRWLIPSEVDTMSFSPYKGYSFRSDIGNSVLQVYPYSNNKGKAKRTVPKSPNGWQTLIKVENESGSDVNYFGISNDASVKRDQYDYPEPPSGLTGTSGYFSLTDDQFCTDVRPEIGEGQVWDFVVECNGSTKLTIELPAEFPLGTECYLADLTRQISVNVSDMNTYDFLPETGEGTREFKIIVGSSEYAKQVLGRTFSVPTVTVLNQNIPNPFSDRTTISYELAAEGRVKIAVYNVAGQLVRTLVDEHQMIGRYNITWDGKDQSGRKTSAGMYFYRMQTPNRTATKRMALVK